MMGSYPWLWFIGGLLLIGGEIVLSGVYLLWLGLDAFVVGVLVAVFPDLNFTCQLVSFALAMLGTVSLGFVIQRRGTPGVMASGSSLDVPVRVDHRNAPSSPRKTGNRGDRIPRTVASGRRR